MKIEPLKADEPKPYECPDCKVRVENGVAIATMCEKCGNELARQLQQAVIDAQSAVSSGLPR